MQTECESEEGASHLPDEAGPKLEVAIHELCELELTPSETVDLLGTVETSVTPEFVDLLDIGGAATLDLCESVQETLDKIFPPYSREVPPSPPGLDVGGSNGH